MPDVPLPAGRGRLYELLRSGKFVLLAAEGQVPHAAAWTGRLEVAARTRDQPAMILVRPDGYVAWATGEADLARRDASLRQALRRWCGVPAGDRLRGGIPGS